MIPNQKVPIVKMIPLIEAAEGRGRDTMVTPPWTKSLIVLKKFLIQFRFFFQMNVTVYNSK